MKTIIKNSGPKAVSKPSKPAQPAVSAPANPEVTLPPERITQPVPGSSEAIAREAACIRAELEAGDGVSAVPTASRGKPELVIPPTKREIPKLSGRSRYILDQIDMGEIERFIGDDWTTALCEAAEEALDVADVFEGGLSLAERMPMVRARQKLFESTWTDEDEAEMELFSRAHEIDCARIQGIDVLTYMRSGYKSGVYVLRLIWPDHVHAVATDCPKITGRKLDQEAIMEAYRRMSTLRRTPGFRQEDVEDWAKEFSSQRRGGRHEAGPDSFTRERIRAGLLAPLGEQDVPLRCTIDRRSLSSMWKCQDLAMRSFWMRRSIN